MEYKKEVMWIRTKTIESVNIVFLSTCLGQNGEMMVTLSCWHLASWYSMGFRAHIRGHVDIASPVWQAVHGHIPMSQGSLPQGHRPPAPRSAQGHKSVTRRAYLPTVCVRCLLLQHVKRQICHATVEPGYHWLQGQTQWLHQVKANEREAI